MYLTVVCVCACVCREKEKDVVGAKKTHVRGLEQFWYLIFSPFLKLKKITILLLKFYLGILIEFLKLSTVWSYFYFRLCWSGTEFSNIKMNYVIALLAKGQTRFGVATSAEHIWLSNVANDHHSKILSSLMHSLTLSWLPSNLRSVVIFWVYH